MTLKQETDSIGCLLEALFPGLVPSSPCCAVALAEVRRALESDDECRRRAERLREALERAVRRGGTARGGDDDKAMRLFAEISRSPRLWSQALELIEACEKRARSCP
jgi:hypothetical protein